MKRIIEKIKQHKGIVIGIAVALCFTMGLIATMSGGSGTYSDDNFGYSINSNISGITIGDMSETSGSSSSNMTKYEASADMTTSDEYFEEESATDISKEVNFGDKIIYNGTVNIKSGDIQKTLEVIRDAIEKNGGYITNIDTGNESYGNITARVPSENFDKLVNDENIEKGNTVRRTVSSKDVSLEYSDEQAELETLRIKEERILEYFKSATNVETMLRLESELQSVRSDISSSEKRLRMMDSYVSYSEVNFYVNSRYTKPDEGAPFFERVKYTVEETIHLFKELTIGIVLTVIKLVPFAIYGVAIFFIIRAIIKIRRKRKKEKINNAKGDENLKEGGDE